MEEIKNQQASSYRVRLGLHVGALMSPADVASATRTRGDLDGKILQRWTFCGDVSPSVFELLQAAGMLPASAERLTAFSGPSGMHYAVFTHQMGMFQHRYLAPLFDPRVAECLKVISREGGLMYSLAGESEQAVVWGSVLGSRDFLPLLALAGEVPPGKEEQVLEEYSRVVRELCDPQRVPSLHAGTAVRYASVSAVPPGDLLDRVNRRYGARQ